MSSDLERLVEVGARAIAPSRWEVMDSYLEQAKRKYAGQHVGWPADQFKDKESMAQFRAGLLAILPLLADDLAGVCIEQAISDEHLRDLARKERDITGAAIHACEATAARSLAQAIRTRLSALGEKQ